METNTKMEILTLKLDCLSQNFPLIYLFKLSASSSHLWPLLSGLLGGPCGQSSEKSCQWVLSLLIHSRKFNSISKGQVKILSTMFLLKSINRIEIFYFLLQELPIKLIHTKAARIYLLFVALIEFKHFIWKHKLVQAKNPHFSLMHS